MTDLKSTLVFDVGETDMQDFGWTEAIQGKIKQKHKTKLHIFSPPGLETFFQKFLNSKHLPLVIWEKNKTETVLKATKLFFFFLINATVRGLNLTSCTTLFSPPLVYTTFLEMLN